jgi:hypothetical protein
MFQLYVLMISILKVSGSGLVLKCMENVQRLYLKLMFKCHV